jgi:dipeptidyl aminopeptidase/acylaminoacyl peptidase
VLIVHGETDRRVPYADAYKLANAITASGNSRVEISILPNHNHLLLKESPDGKDTSYGRLNSNSVPDEILTMISDWLNDNI